MAINKRRFSREATYARRCLRGRSCVRGWVVPCPAPQAGKVSGMGMQDRRPPRMRKKFPHQDSTLPTPGRAVCPVPCQEAAADPRSHRGDRRCLRRRAGSVCPPLYQEAAAGPRSCQGDRRCLPPPGRFCLPCSLPGGRSRPQEPPGRPQRPPPPGVCVKHTAWGTAETDAGAATFNARRDYELLEQVVSTYGR